MDFYICPDNKAHGANVGPTWGRQDHGGPHVGHMNFAIGVVFSSAFSSKSEFYFDSNFITVCSCIGQINQHWFGQGLHAFTWTSNYSDHWLELQCVKEYSWKRNHDIFFGHCIKGAEAADRWFSWSMICDCVYIYDRKKMISLEGKSLQCCQKQAIMPLTQTKKQAMMPLTQTINFHVLCQFLGNHAVYITNTKCLSGRSDRCLACFPLWQTSQFFSSYEVRFPVIQELSHSQVSCNARSCEAIVEFYTNILALVIC